ncbi:Bug family tripartite tricarboxylate transporter substrate binding protein [Bosea sp. PAMC 26642]|uniref:Bug family tripartite tricarboxylate transporter substrate binding protein n=1 Tax=Bosea sp. (strain PAMC 26642) TaxID=1792307 RepID=UPI000770325F|nr:tripartite tricarboxylate transporter substrate binding protein [Bosea sp. PAMC 26642]AMJ61525.1 hypothetical protein AXW83_15525 [Bosea sp. PAMC 26642]
MAITRRRLIQAAGATLALPGIARAAGYPERDITLLVPWPPGGGTDTLARTLVKNAQKYLGASVTVVNRTGGNGVVGMQAGAQAKPDGYTLSLITLHLSSYRLLGVNPLSYRDFEPLALLNRSLGVLAVKADSPFQTLKDLIEYAKANPGVVTVGNSGAGAPPHLSAALIAKTYGFKWTLVPFEGTAPARTAVAGGHITVLASGADEALQFYKTKQMRYLAITADQRHPSFQEVPTIAEAGYPVDGLILDWRGIAVPKGTPPEIQTVLMEGIRKMANDPDYIQLMDNLALPRANMEGEQFRQFLESMEQNMAPALKEVGLLKA